MAPLAGTRPAYAMCALLKDALQQRWEDSLRERATLSLRSIVPFWTFSWLPGREPATKIGSGSAPNSAPRIGHRLMGPQPTRQPR